MRRFDLIAGCGYLLIAAVDAATGQGWYPTWVWGVFGVVWLVVWRRNVRRERLEQERRIDRMIRRLARRRAER